MPSATVVSPTDSAMRMIACARAESPEAWLIASTKGLAILNVDRASLAQRLCQDPPAAGHDQARLLGERDEVE